MSKQTWTKASIQGVWDLVKSVGKTIFSEPLSKKIMEVPVVKWEDVMQEAMQELKEKNNDDSSNVSGVEYVFRSEKRATKRSSNDCRSNTKQSS